MTELTGFGTEDLQRHRKTDTKAYLHVPEYVEFCNRLSVNLDYSYACELLTENHNENRHILISQGVLTFETSHENEQKGGGNVDNLDNYRGNGLHRRNIYKIFIEFTTKIWSILVKLIES